MFPDGDGREPDAGRRADDHDRRDPRHLGRKAYTEALEHRALHDDLTGLPNRTLFADRMDRAIASADRAGEPRGVLLVDLDEFREVNETLGRETGDALLKAVAERLCGAMGDQTPWRG